MLVRFKPPLISNPDWAKQKRSKSVLQMSKMHSFFIILKYVSIVFYIFLNVYDNGKSINLRTVT
jgi:hypothetical protein